MRSTPSMHARAIGLPNHLHLVSGDLSIVGQDRHPLQLALRDQQAIKQIAMVPPPYNHLTGTTGPPPKLPFPHRVESS